MSLTDRNKRAIDLYLTPGSGCEGNGTAAWQRVYETKNRTSAWNGWSRMIRDVEAKAYLERRRTEIEAQRAEMIAYEQADAVRDFLRIQRAAMQLVNRGRVARKVKTKDPETGEEVERVEYADVQGMLDPGEALRATEGAIRVQGKHPDQRAEGAGVMVNISIDTQWRGRQGGGEPIDVTETPDEPPSAPELPASPSVVVIGKRPQKGQGGG